MTPSSADSTTAEFDHPEYRRIDHAREAWLRRVLPLLPVEARTVLDVGCGAGYFSGVLDSLGYAVTGIDLRPENLAVCRQRYPRCTFEPVNLDLDIRVQLGSAQFEIGLLFGIFYHLQSPLQTINQLAGVIDRYCIVETRVAAGDELACYLYHEVRGPAHNTAPAVLVPTRPAILSLFATAGFTNLYEPAWPVEHEQWDPQHTPDGLRCTFIAARSPLDHGDRRRLSSPSPVYKWARRP